MIKAVNYFPDQKVEGIFMKGIRPHIKIKQDLGGGISQGGQGPFK